MMLRRPIECTDSKGRIATLASRLPGASTRPLSFRKGAGGDGVYGYGTASTFPTTTYQALNYWVDVVFSTSAQ
jgi:Domain of unknown function (DUF4082)